MVAPAKPPPPLDVSLAVGDGGDGDVSRWCGDALESAASRALTTHSSPYDVSDDEKDHHPEIYPQSTKSVDDAMPSDYYQSVETPRSVVTGGGGSAPSIRSIQIQIDAIHPTHSEAPDRTPTTVRGRRLCGRSDAPPPTKRPLSFDKQCRAAVLQTLVVIGPPALVLLFLHFSISYIMLMFLNVVAALAAWEWMWWSFRIRRRLLEPLQPASSNDAPLNDQPTSLQDRQDAILNEPVLAISRLMKNAHPRAKYFIAGGIALAVAAVIVPLVEEFSDSITTKHGSDVGKNVLLASTVSSILTAVFCACLAPTPADAVILCVYEASFVVSSLNSFLSHHENLVHDPELLDSMYVLLVGACTIVVWRVVSSKEVMESTIMAMTDILGLGYLVAPMMAMADFLGHPKVQKYDDNVGTFFVVVSAAEAAYRLNEILKHKFPRFLQTCRRPVAKLVSHTLGYESLVLSIVFGGVGAVISMLSFHGYIFHWQDALVYLSAILMSQICRLALESMKAMAKVDDAKYQPWLSGYLDLVNPYMLAMIVFHPYVKALIKGCSGNCVPMSN